MFWQMTVLPCYTATYIDNADDNDDVVADDQHYTKNKPWVVMNYKGRAVPMHYHWGM